MTAGLLILIVVFSIFWLVFVGLVFLKLKLLRLSPAWESSPPFSCSTSSSYLSSD